MVYAFQNHLISEYYHYEVSSFILSSSPPLPSQADKLMQDGLHEGTFSHLKNELLAAQYRINYIPAIINNVFGFSLNFSFGVGNS